MESPTRIKNILTAQKTFLSIFLSGTALSFLLWMNHQSFDEFLVVFSIGSVSSFLIAISWTEIERKHVRLAAVAAVFVAFSLTTVFYMVNSSMGHKCLAWSAHSAENPLTDQCETFVYGGCGPTPEPWYYRDSCSPESTERMCDRLENSSKEDADELHYHLCTDYPDLNFTAKEYDERNETLTLEITESEFNSSNTENLKIVGRKDEGFRMKRGDRIYNTSNLLAKYNRSVFNGSLEVGDRFTVTYDGSDLDKDERKGADNREEDYATYVLRWQKEEDMERGKLLGHMRFREGDFEYSQRF